MPDITVTNYALDLCALAVAGQVDTFGANSDLELRLVNVDFSPDPTLGIDDLTYNSGSGLSAKVGAATTPTMTWDPEMGVWGISIPFTGGNVFTATAVDIPAQIAYGWAIVNPTADKLVLTGKFDTPIEFTHVGVSAHVPETSVWFAAPFIGDLPTVSA